MGESKRRDAWINRQPDDVRQRLAQQEVMKYLDRVLNGDVPRPLRGTDFILLTFPVRHQNDRANYSSSASRERSIAILREQLRFMNPEEDKALREAISKLGEDMVIHRAGEKS